ncbi:MAG: leader peptidase (prepilin peptidase) / N-methyltransferase [Gaiellaceae bacterium]|jgi:leader peptidase (prepilin peptidase)/N-methyltransferase|nr:leader peptidase (prepilin peptidase) / N-methyltransferase [Gaiellaceae bacterium]
MDFALAAVVFAPALALGSFLNVVAARVPLRRSIVRPPSACMSCAHELRPYDNVPLLSYALLRGRCRHCQARIPFVYPAVELVTALLLAGCVLAFGLSAEAAVAAFFCAVLVAVSAIDLEHRIIPNRIVLPATVLVLVANTARDLSPEWALGALGASGFLFAAALAYPAGMGMGDVKLALLMGAALGRTVPVALMAGMLAAMIPSLYLFARHGAKARKMGIPFGPFLAIGSVVALFWGHDILHAYFATLH